MHAYHQFKRDKGSIITRFQKLEKTVER